jgi:hypothetical protein
MTTKLVDALKAKYKTGREALRAFGLGRRFVGRRRHPSSQECGQDRQPSSEEVRFDGKGTGEAWHGSVHVD